MGYVNVPRVGQWGRNLCVSEALRVELDNPRFAACTEPSCMYLDLSGPIQRAKKSMTNRSFPKKLEHSACHETKLRT